MALSFSLGAIVFGAGQFPASASTSQSCVEKALDAKMDQWVCVGDDLVNSMFDEGSDYSIPLTYIDVTPSISVQPRALIDYDSWCEIGSICTRLVNYYISETKGNAAYGNSSGVIGSFDVILRTNLNGRQPRWNLYLIHDTGPSLIFSGSKINCRETGNFWGCGSWPADGNDGIINLGISSYYGPMIYGNALVNPGMYHGTVTAYFQPFGYPAYSIAPLNGQSFQCDGLVCNF